MSSNTRSSSTQTRAPYWQTKEFWIKQILLLLFGAIGLGLVIYSAVTHTSTEFNLAPVLREIGIALLIVVIATATIESVRVKMFSRELQDATEDKLRQIADTAADKILQGPLPESYYYHVKREMLLRPIFRSNWHINAILTPKVENALELVFDQEYTVENCAKLEETYSVEAYQSLETEFADRARIRHVRARFERSIKYQIDESAPDDGATVGDRDATAIKFKKSVLLRPGVALTITVGTLEWTYPNDMFFVVVNDPTAGARCVIDHPESTVVKFEFPEGESEGTRHAAIESVEKLPGGIMRSTWDFPFPIVPTATIICYWFPRMLPIAATGHTDAATGRTEGK
jgi:hypothetical protein